MKEIHDYGGNKFKLILRKVLIILSPVVILIDLYVLNFILHMVSAQSDINVLLGVILLCIELFANYLLIKFLTNKKQKK